MTDETYTATFTLNEDGTLTIRIPRTAAGGVTAAGGEGYDPPSKALYSEYTASVTEVEALETLLTD